MPEEWEQKNVNLTKDDVALAIKMMREDGLDNFSAFVRALVRKEAGRRYSNNGMNAVLVFDQQVQS